MTEETDRLQKLISIATDLKISGELRTEAITQLGGIGTHAALVALLDLVSDETFTKKERTLALKQAGKILNPNRPWRYFLWSRGRS
jgi:HEAT repeat protein